MLYMPATTAATPVILQEGFSAPLLASSRYYMLQSAPMIPAVPVLNTTYVYPRYGFVPRPVETSMMKEDLEKSQVTQLVEGLVWCFLFSSFHPSLSFHVFSCTNGSTCRTSSYPRLRSTDLCGLLWVVLSVDWEQSSTSATAFASW